MSFEIDELKKTAKWVILNSTENIGFDKSLMKRVSNCLKH